MSHNVSSFSIRANRGTEIQKISSSFLFLEIDHLFLLRGFTKGKDIPVVFCQRSSQMKSLAESLRQ